MKPEVIRSRLLKEVPHGFLGRRGGVSRGVCAGLNVGHGSGDDAEAIAANRELSVEAVAPGAQLVTVYQVHSAVAVRVSEAFPYEARPQADAMVTDRPGLALGIVTADCTPVLFADLRAGVVGAAHAGWRGSLTGVIEATVEEMRKLGAETIAAAVGPTIARRSYEVDDGFYARFVGEDPAYEHFFSAGRTGHHQFDLEGFVVSRIAAAGIDRIEALGLDTYSDADRFFSFRRSTHRGEPNYGRQISLIALPG
jgi:YfiH family protein